MTTWLAFYRQTCLDELIRHDGLGNRSEDPPCEDCGDGLGAYRCLECVGRSLMCLDCVVGAHKRTPLHRIEVSIFAVINSP
jgi:hypothetical protein